MPSNIPLFILDWIILLPMTILRLILIYLYGGRYGISGLSYLDIMMHAKNPKFNFGDDDIKNKKNFTTEMKKNNDDKKTSSINFIFTNSFRDS
jgi:hypothetical protein